MAALADSHNLNDWVETPMEQPSPPAVGAKDLRDLVGVSRNPVVAFLQKQAAPSAPRPEGSPSIVSSESATSSVGSAMAAATHAFETLKQFEPSDYVRWISEYLKYRLGPKHVFLTYDGKQPAHGIYALTSDEPEIRIGLGGDWGTGTDEAHRVAKLLCEFDPHFTVHLGDVYFVGDASEVKENFLGLQRPGCQYTPCKWPLGSKAGFALNGNHEMYARGVAYFDEILPMMGEVVDSRPQGQKASYFCLKNDDWCILGLDTGYNSIGTPLVEYVFSPDASLPQEIVDWLQAIAGSIQDQGIIILSHHQVLSVYDSCFTKQADQIFSILKRPVLWFWGHEHRLMIYDAYTDPNGRWPTVTGRCIGHAGMPIDLPGKQKSGSMGTAEYVDKRLYKNDERLHVGMNGFVRLKMTGDALKVEYVDIHDMLVFEETFKSVQGAVSRTGSVNYLLARP
jgi:Calcineurin-like phosphoesterase